MDDEDEEEILEEEANKSSQGPATAGVNDGGGLRSRSAASLEAAEVEAIETVRLAVSQQAALIPLLIREQQNIAEKTKEAAKAHEQAVSGSQVFILISVYEAQTLSRKLTTFKAFVLFSFSFF